MNFAAIDWKKPWLFHLHALGPSLKNSPDWLELVNQQAINQNLFNANNQQISFAAQEGIADLFGYEAHIFSTGEIPTRDNLHDFFNALMWLRFPFIKQTLNYLHQSEIQRIHLASSAVSQRGRQRDAATLFDENCALVISSDVSFIEDLKLRRWKSLLMQDSDQFFARCEVILFGHALLEKLTKPYKAITAHVWTVLVDCQWFDYSTEERLTWLDRHVADDLAQGFVSSDFCHLPVLGVPGWWPDQIEEFYDDVDVFRPLRAG
jgi:hypothetical protein